VPPFRASPLLFERGGFSHAARQATRRARPELVARAKPALEQEPNMACPTGSYLLRSYHPVMSCLKNGSGGGSNSGRKYTFRM
jgi:hypothetical protein